MDFPRVGDNVMNTLITEGKIEGEREFIFLGKNAKRYHLEIWTVANFCLAGFKFCSSL